jgi:flagellar hook-length control protein FliK
MQTPPLPIQPAAPAPQRANAAPTPNQDAPAFSAALAREVAQRQQAANAAQSAAAQTATARAAAQPHQPEDPAADPALAQAAAPQGTKPATEPAADSDPAAGEQGDTAQAAAAQATDVLALVASLNLPGTVQAQSTAQPAAAQAGVALAAGRGKDGAAAQLAALQQQAGAAAAKEGAIPAAEGFFDRLHNLAGGVRSAPSAAVQGNATPGAATAATTGQPDAQAALAQPAARDAGAPREPVQLAAHNAAREAVQDAAAMKETLAKAAAQDSAAPAPLLAPAVAAPLQVVQAAGVVPNHIAARVGTQAWDQQVGQKIVWMVAGEEQSASLTLNPPDLGPMQVVLSVTNDQASVAFSSHEPEVRQALQDALPRLREMMSESGIALGNATVDAGMPDGRQAQGGEQPRSSGGARFAGVPARAGAEPVVATRVTTLGGRGAVDTFA